MLFLHLYTRPGRRGTKLASTAPGWASVRCAQVPVLQYWEYTLGPALRTPDIKNLGMDFVPERLRTCPCAGGHHYATTYTPRGMHTVHTAHAPRTAHAAHTTHGPHMPCMLCTSRE